MTFAFGQHAIRLLLGVLATATTFGAQLTLTWDDNSSAEAGFRIERSTDGVSFVQIGEVGANVVTYTDKSVTSATTYSYRVAAYNDVVTSTYSNVTSVTTAPLAVSPSILSQPTAAQTVTAGAGVTFSVSVSGTPAPVLQWRKNGEAVGNATGSTFQLHNVTSADAATYSVVATNSAGSITSQNALLAVSTPSVQPTVVPVAIAPTTPVLAPAPAVVPPPPPVPAAPPPIPASVTTAAPKISLPASLVEIPSTPPRAPVPSRLVNLSVRAVPGPGDRALLVGFVVSGGSKSVMLRAVGPGLATYSDLPVFTDPKLTVSAGSASIGSNDNWGGGETMKSNFSRLGAFPLPELSKDAVLLSQFAPRAYTANVTGSGTGLALAEIYDADAATDPAGRLVNASARAHAAPGDGVLIIGFVVAGDTSLKVLVRAIGPALAAQGVSAPLVDPKLSLHRGSTVVKANDNWAGDSELKAAFAQAGAFALSHDDSKDAALIVTLEPGAYTAIVSGVNGTAGIALAEVYELR